ncbi:MAG: dihydrofolate reductase family protein [Candidatus Paceibacterota bacterium]|jgi:dihydrofolate reductase
MKTFIIAALTADGYIGKHSTHAAMWTSKEDKKRFIEITKRAGVIIMGQNTWKTLGKPLKDRLNIVYSPTPLEGITEGVEVTIKSPTDLLKDLENRGFKEVAICGGSQIYTMFMKSGLVDTLYLTIEPIVFGDGMRLFKEDMDFKLKLISCVQTENGSLLLEYKVEK